MRNCGASLVCYTKSVGACRAGGRNHQPGAGAKPVDASHAGSVVEDHTSTPAPNCTARAQEAHDPDPPPENAAPGRTPTGQGCPAAGQTTSSPDDAATACTRAADRWARAAGCCEAARNTRADGEASDTAASTPDAHPTKEGRPAKCGTTDSAAATAAGQRREPEKPTTGKGGSACSIIAV